MDDALYSEYLYQEQYFIKKDSKEEIYCQLPRENKIEDFGMVPRSRYPLVALLTLADEDDREIYDIVWRARIRVSSARNSDQNHALLICWHNFENRLP